MRKRTDKVEDVCKSGDKMRVKLIKVLRVRISSKNGKAGSVIDENLTIGCDSDSIQILELQRQGKNKQNAKDFLLGSKINKGTILI